MTSTFDKTHPEIKLPLTFEEALKDGQWFLVDGNDIAFGEINNKRYIKFIVTACNNHDKLVEALKLWHKSFDVPPVRKLSTQLEAYAQTDVILSQLEKDGE